MSTFGKCIKFSLFKLIILSYFGLSFQLMNPNVCKSEFFTLLADKMPWRQNQTEDCLVSFTFARDKIVSLSHRIAVMNSTLTIYTSMNNLPACKSLYEHLTNVNIVYFDGVKLLQEYGYINKIKERIDLWALTGYTRSSDIYRLMIAHKYNQIYTDNDIYFLNTSINLYTIPFVGVGVWQDIENALEISNCVFCLPKNILYEMILFQQNRIQNGISTYYYTELGPSMFHKILMNKQSGISLYSQNHPKEIDIKKIAQSIHIYGHLFLHLTTSIRKDYRTLTMNQIANKIKIAANIPLSNSMTSDEGMVVGGLNSRKKRNKHTKDFMFTNQ